MSPCHGVPNREPLGYAVSVRSSSKLANHMQGPIIDIGPFNTFTLVQLLTMEFAGALEAILSPETLERDHSSINASARLKFAAAIKAEKAFALAYGP